MGRSLTVSVLGLPSLYLTNFLLDIRTALLHPTPLWDSRNPCHLKRYLTAPYSTLQHYDTAPYSTWCCEWEKPSFRKVYLEPNPEMGLHGPNLIDHRRIFFVSHRNFLIEFFFFLFFPNNLTLKYFFFKFTLCFLSHIFFTTRETIFFVFFVIFLSYFIIRN